MWPHVRVSETVLDSGFQTTDYGFQVLDSSLCEWNVDSWFQSLLGFRILWAVFRIPKPRISDSTRKNFQHSLTWGEKIFLLNKVEVEVEVEIKLRKNIFKSIASHFVQRKFPARGDDSNLENRHSTQVGCCYQGGPAQTTATSHEGLRTRTLLASISCRHVHSAKTMSHRACDSFYFRVLWNVTFTDAWLLYNSKR